ncbi:hemopexin repeat-containing protein [Streptomyces sp. NPDC001404]|uniref:hemopexin repeat-containing protein n=1 Tax=Streptomyces sp. NPDC001404 TaxID=3364571 RepID=UPI00369AF155
MKENSPDPLSEPHLEDLHGQRHNDARPGRPAPFSMERLEIVGGFIDVKQFHVEQDGRARSPHVGITAATESLDLNGDPNGFIFIRNLLGVSDTAAKSTWSIGQIWHGAAGSFADTDGVDSVFPGPNNTVFIVSPTAPHQCLQLSLMDGSRAAGPGPLREMFPGLPGVFYERGIDAGLSMSNSDRGEYVYLISGDQCAAYDMRGLTCRDVSVLSQVWPSQYGELSYVDAALVDSKNNRAYFFNGPQYMEYDWENQYSLGPWKEIQSKWPRLPYAFGGERRIDGFGVLSPAHGAIVFREDEFLVMDPWGLGQVYLGPNNISTLGSGLPLQFRSGIDAISILPTSEYGVYDCFILKGEEACQCRMRGSAPPGNIALEPPFSTGRIADRWISLPPNFKKNVDAMGSLVGADERPYAWLIKGQDVMLFDPRGTGRPISSDTLAQRWPNLPPIYRQHGVDAMAAFLDRGSQTFWLISGDQVVKDPETGQSASLASVWPRLPWA